MEQLRIFADAVARVAATYLVAFAAIGALTMAVIQTIKELTAVRRWFHRRQFTAWLAGCATAGGLASDSLRTARRDLVGLATSGDEAALFDLETERLAGQLSAAAAIVVDFPARYRAALLCLASHAASEDLEAVLEGADLGRAHLDDLREKPGERDKYDRFVDSKARVAHQVQRCIDAFQICTEFRWKFYLQIVSFSVSYVLTMIGLGINAPESGRAAAVVRSIPFAVAAGFLAPIAHDLVATLTGARRS